MWCFLPHIEANHQKYLITNSELNRSSSVGSTIKNVNQYGPTDLCARAWVGYHLLVTFLFMTSKRNISQSLNFTGVMIKICAFFRYQNLSCYGIKWGGQGHRWWNRGWGRALATAHPPPPPHSQKAGDHAPSFTWERIQNIKNFRGPLAGHWTPRHFTLQLTTLWVNLLVLPHFQNRSAAPGQGCWLGHQPLNTENRILYKPIFSRRYFLISRLPNAAPYNAIHYVTFRASLYSRFHASARNRRK